MPINTDREALDAIQRIIDKARAPDGWVTVSSLLDDVSEVLAQVGPGRSETRTKFQRKVYPSAWRGH